ncbi:DUF305 domain-containing protein [Blastococcus deserti]|uniref:DUF305 domain-containing protein n=1 Tax=Blastococcus deserti TaxID=2259033 RepID=A0ABW4X631_9ACTN
MSPTTRRPSHLVAAVVTAGTLALAGCSSGTNHGDSTSMSTSMSSTSSPSVPESSATEVNAADVSFAQGMIPHHRQAMDMSRLAESRAQDPRVIDLAGRIEAAQGPEIEVLTGWLEEWDQEPAADHGGHGGGDMAGGDAMGTMSEADMDALAGASGAEFDRRFLQQMIEHHSGAVRMAEAEIDDGRFAAAVQLAETIRRTQSDEIAEMERLLADLDD